MLYRQLTLHKGETPRVKTPTKASGGRIAKIAERNTMSSAIKVMAVDDEQMNLEMIEVMLSKIDCRVIKSANGYEALESLKTNADIDLVLLDLCMPVMDGYETISQLKQSCSWKDIPIVVVSGGSSEVTRSLELGATDFLTKPYNPEELRLRVMNHVRLKKRADLANDVNLDLEQEINEKVVQLEQALRHSREAEYEISVRLGKAAEFRDKETGMHTRRIGEMSKHLGKLAGLSEKQCEVLRRAAPLHDVGKIGIPDKILLKPGKLDEAEFEIMKQHTMIGGAILSDSANFQLLDAGATIALQHHEKWDGSGYPRGLAGAEIHRYARIVSIVDVFDALTSERPYKRAFSIEDAVGIMEAGRAEFFDPELLSTFLWNLDRFIGIKEVFKDAPVGPGELSN